MINKLKYDVLVIYNKTDEMKKLFSLLIYLVLTISIVNASVVTVSGRKIMVDDSQFIIKGICYNPVPKGSSERSWATLTQDLALMTEAGVNTIRVYSPIDEEEVLDEIAEAGMRVIIGFGYNMDGYYDILSGTFIDYIKKYKNHEAILLWEFGNEYNYHPEWFGDDITNWYKALNDAALEASIEDTNHPTATAHGELPDATARSMCPHVAVWGLNVYRWDDPSSIFDEWQVVSNKPMYLSEAGGDRYMTATMNGFDEGENPEAQAQATRNILNATFNHQDICTGVMLFEFSDEWWKAGDPNSHDKGGWAPNSGGVPYDGAPNEEYWGIVDIDRNKTLAFDEVKTKYNSIVSNNTLNKDILSIYPNPTQNRLSVMLEDEKSSIELYSISGSLLLQIDGSKGTNELDISDLSNGIYLLQTRDNSGIIKSAKVIKE